MATLKVDKATARKLQYVANVAEGLASGKYSDDEPTRRAVELIVKTFNTLQGHGGEAST